MTNRNCIVAVILLLFTFNLETIAAQNFNDHCPVYRNFDQIYSPYSFGRGLNLKTQRKVDRILSQDKGYVIKEKTLPEVGDYLLFQTGQKLSFEICRIQIQLAQITELDPKGKIVKFDKIGTYSSWAMGIDLLDSPSDYCLRALLDAVPKIPACKDLNTAGR